MSADKPILTEVREALTELVEFYDHYGRSPSNQYKYEQALRRLSELGGELDSMLLEFKPEYNDGNHDTALTLVTTNNALVEAVKTKLGVE